MAIEFQSVIPIFRVFDINKAAEFYLEYLGFKVDWDHRFDDNAPLYQQVRAHKGRITTQNSSADSRHTKARGYDW